jgi:putative RNA 2'-phosphotransferase
MRKELIRKSKYLSLVLRHQPSAAGIALDENGWVAVEDLLHGARNNGVQLSYDELCEIVDTNEKKRFVFDESGRRIRANQGHSVNVDLELAETTPPPMLYHGTTERFLESIQKEGLQKMNRHHVHLSADTGTAHRVGMRRGKVIILEVDAKRMNSEGFTFYQSKNGVWLVDHVPPRYLT